MGAEAHVPAILQVLAALAEFAGGMGLIIGLLTRLASLGLVTNMSVALALVHLPSGDPFVGKPEAGRMNLPLSIWPVQWYSFSWGQDDSLSTPSSSGNPLRPSRLVNDEGSGPGELYHNVGCDITSPRRDRWRWRQ